jgi:hypothetical protein
VPITSRPAFDLAVSDRLEIPVTRRRILWIAGLILFGSGFLGGGYAALAARDPATGIFAACCGVFTALVAVNLRSSRPWLLTPDGFRWSGPAGGVMYRWDEVDRFRPGLAYSPTGSVNFDFVSGHAPGGLGSRALTAIARTLSAADRNLPNNTVVPTAQLIVALKAWRHAYGDRHDGSGRY